MSVLWVLPSNVAISGKCTANLKPGFMQCCAPVGSRIMVAAGLCCLRLGRILVLLWSDNHGRYSWFLSRSRTVFADAE